MVLHQLAQQFAPVAVQARLQLAVLEPTGALALQDRADGVEALPGRAERVHGVGVHRRARSRRAASAASPSRAWASSSALACW